MSTKKYQNNDISLGGRLRKFRKSKGDDVVLFSKLLNISQGSLSAYENNKTIISSEAIINLVQNTDINIDWLLTGKGEMIRQGAESDISLGKMEDALDEDTEIAGLLDAVKKVFKSGTGYSEILIANIRLLHHAMKTEKSLKGVEKRLAKLEETKKILKEKAARIREGDNEAEKDAILKKRVACFS